MIATHNIKVNGRWIHAGTEYGAEPAETPKKVRKPVEEPEEAVPAEEEKPQTETKAKSTGAARRKKVSE